MWFRVEIGYTGVLSDYYKYNLTNKRLISVRRFCYDYFSYIILIEIFTDNLEVRQIISYINYFDWRNFFENR